MNIEPWQREFEVALGAVREGASLAREIREHIQARAWLKPDQSPVTVAEFAVQALVAHRLGEAFPHDPIVAEEDAAALRASTGQSMLESVLVSLRRVVPELDANRVLDLIDHTSDLPSGIDDGHEAAVFVPHELGDSPRLVSSPHAATWLVISRPLFRSVDLLVQPRGARTGRPAHYDR